VIGTPDTTKLGLLVYGHRGNNDDSGRAESCAGIEVFAPLGELTAASVPGVLDRFQPTGWTPIGASLDRAGEVFAGTEDARNRVILVTDGIETCDGDPVGAARRLANSGVTVTVDVVGFDVETQGDRRALKAIAEASGGMYTDAADAGQLDAYVDELLRAREDARSAWLCLRGAVDQAGACSNFFLTEAGAVVARERDSIADSSSPQWQELNHIWRSIADSNVERYEQLRAEYDPILAELEAAYRAANERYSRRYGRPVSVAPSIDCPLLDQIALLREPAVGPSVG
jgi:von Willebrand factor type A domain